MSQHTVVSFKLEDNDYIGRITRYIWTPNHTEIKHGKSEVLVYDEGLHSKVRQYSYGDYDMDKQQGLWCFCDFKTRTGWHDYFSSGELLYSISYRF